MTRVFKDGVMKNADCLEALMEEKENSVAAVFVDPPYGKQTKQDWDVAWKPDFWRKVVQQSFRVMKTGGHMIVFSGGKTIFDIHNNILMGYKSTFKKDPSFYRMVWKHHSLDASRPHKHIPRSQFEDVLVYFHTGQNMKHMLSQGTLNGDDYALNKHVGRTNVLEFYKDNCKRKPQKTVQDFFKVNSRYSTFDYKPEGLMRALICDFSSPGQTIIDVCMRHGITAVAAKLENRKFIGVELDAQSYKRAVSRYEEQFMEMEGAVTTMMDVDERKPLGAKDETAKDEVALSSFWRNVFPSTIPLSNETKSPTMKPGIRQ